MNDWRKGNSEIVGVKQKIKKKTNEGKETTKYEWKHISKLISSRNI